MNGSETVHENPWFAVSLREERGQSWFRVERPDSAMIIGTTPDGTVLLISGPRDTTGPQSLLEFPCGAVEQGESPEDAAVRETREETGFASTRLERVGSFVESPGISAAICHVFRADVVPGGPAALESGEDWEVALLHRAELADAIRRGEVKDGGTLAAWALLLAAEG